MLDVTEHSAVAGATKSSEKKPTKNWRKVNRKLLPMKAHFFLFFGSFAGTGPACIMYCTKVGMSMSEIGTLYAVLPFIQFLSKIVFGCIADKYHKHKTAFLASIFFMGAFLFSLNFLPFPSDGVHKVDWKPADDATFECRRHSIMNDSSGTMWLKVCDRNASNQYFAVLSSATVACNVSCDTSGLQDISTLFCDENNPNCISNNRYSFYDAANMRRSTTSFSVVSSSDRNSDVSPADGSVKTNNSSCVYLSVDSASFDFEASTIKTISSEGAQMNRTTVTSCHVQVDTELETSISCRAMCVAAVKPSAYAPAVALRDTTLQYVWIWLAFLISWCAYGTLMSTSDTIVLHLLDGRSQDFGKTRLFGSLGWGLMAPIVGYIIDKVSEGRPEKDYSPGFYLFGAFMLADFLVNIPTKVYIAEKSQKLMKDIILVFRRPPVILTAFAVFVNGITTGFLWTFLVVFANELSGGMQIIIGLNYAVECFLSEIPFFIVSGWVVSKIGHSHAMTVSLFFCGLKTFLYSLIYNAWFLLGISLFHGVTYGLLYASMATYIGEISPPGTAATLQGIFQGIFEGIGVAVGNLIGGQSYENIGGRQTFLLFGLVTMGASVVHFLVAFILKRISKGPSLNTKIPLPSLVSGALQPRDT